MVQQVSQNSRQNALSNLLVRVKLNNNNNTKTKNSSDLLSLEPGCSEEDKANHSTTRTKSSATTPDDDNVILLYELEGGLFGQQSYDASYVEYVKQGSILRNITNVPKVSSSTERNGKTEEKKLSSNKTASNQPFHSMPASMDVDDYMWSN